MAYNPINLLLRFFLEISSWYCMGLLGYRLSESGLRYLFMLIIPLLSILIWGTFNVLGDKSRSGKALIVVSGWIRLIIELTTFGFGVWILFYLNYSIYGFIYIFLILLHYALSYDRVKWLLEN